LCSVLTHRRTPVTSPLSLHDALPIYISDTHLTPGRKRLLAWLRSLDDLDPHLVINTGDSISHPQAIQPFLDALGPLLDRPGAFVLGSNDMYAPEPHNPARYLMGPSSHWRIRKGPALPGEKLRDARAAAGGLDLNNPRGRLKADGRDAPRAGVHDAHVKRARYALVAGPADPSADLRIGVMHSPEP